MTTTDRVLADADAREPDLRLSEDDLRLAASRSPVRDALAWVEAEERRERAQEQADGLLR